MALVKYGSIITDAAGKIGGVCYQRKHGSSRVRSSTHKASKQTDTVTKIRAQFAHLVDSFNNGLSASTRARWLEFALRHPIKNNFGDARILSPLAAYIRQNKILVWLGLPRVNTPPEPHVFQSDLAFTGQLFRVSDQQIRIVAKPNPFPADYILFGYQTGPLGRGAARSFRRHLKLIATDQVANPRILRWDLEWISLFGALQENMLLGFSCQVVHRATGYTRELYAGTALSVP